MTTLEQLMGAVRADVDSAWLPACQVAVGYRGEIVAFGTFGAASDDTRFNVFSATKPLVASAVWLLIGEGRLDVSRRVVDYVPEFGTHGKDVVTVEQLLLHTAGVPSPRLLAEGAVPDVRLRSFEEWELEWEPGSRFEYHAVSAHWVLAELIERLGGMDFRDYVEQRVTAPLGLPRVLGVPDSQLDHCAHVVSVGETALDGFELLANEPAYRAAGIPAGGAFMTAAELAGFYQGLLHDPDGIWDAGVLTDAKTNIRCTFDDPLMGVPANRSLGLVLAGDDGKHMLRYAIFGADCSPGSFGHAGAHAQVGWADPESGISFAYLTNGLDADVMREAIRSNGLATIASALEL